MKVVQCWFRKEAVDGCCSKAVCMFLYFDVAVLQPMRKKLYSDLYFHPFFCKFDGGNH